MAAETLAVRLARRKAADPTTTDAELHRIICAALGAAIRQAVQTARVGAIQMDLPLEPAQEGAQ